jgi:glycosyltransferase involved in cell wall biosynthesis
MKKITVLIPIFNEINTLKLILEKIDEVSFCGLEKEIILIDDYSTDGTRGILAELKETCPDKYKIFYHEKNMGKGAALRTGFEHVTGDITIIQDADLEYNPEDYEPLIKVLVDGEADVVYGSRFLNEKSEFMLLSKLANKFLTFITNILYGVHLTDMETCYKAFKTEFIKGIQIKSNRFDFEPEITAKVLKKGAKLKELPISYNAREYDEGKKITWKDGVHAILALVKFRFSD